MMMLLSPAKTLDMSPVKGVSVPTAAPAAESKELLQVAKKLSQAQIKNLMGLSDALAKLNYERFQGFEKQPSKHAALAFDGPAFRGLQAESFNASEAKFASKHLRVLSGLYGTLKPYDLIRPYRLEMGSKLGNARGKDLYSFWGDTIAKRLLSEFGSAAKGAILVNCASQEYFKAVQTKLLLAAGVKVITVDFPGPAVYAKKARGLMCRHIIQTGTKNVDGLKKFTGDDEDSYAFDAKSSTAEKLVFKRQPAGADKKRKGAPEPDEGSTKKAMKKAK